MLVFFIRLPIDITKKRADMANLIVHGIVESIELVWTVESDASEASFLCDSDR